MFWGLIDQFACWGANKIKDIVQDIWPVVADVVLPKTKISLANNWDTLDAHSNPKASKKFFTLAKESKEMQKEATKLSEEITQYERNEIRNLLDKYEVF